MNIHYWLALTCLATCLHVQAETSFKPIELKDQELSELRGRFVMPGRIISFGLVMSSTWTNAQGATIGASTSLHLQNSVKPQFYVSTYSQQGTPQQGKPDTGTGIVLGGAGLGSGQGVVQSVRAAGDNNSALNNVDISISQSGQAPALTQQGSVLTATNPVSLSNAAGSISVAINNGAIQMAIAANNNQGNSLQQIAQGGVLQNTTLLGGGNAVNNMTQLNMVLGNTLPSTEGLNSNLNQLKALRAAGY